MGLNLRGLFDQVIPDLTPEKQAELRKLQLEVERIKASKRLEGDNLGNIIHTRIIVTGFILLFFMLFCWLSIPKLVNQRIATKGGFSFIDGNMVRKEDIPLALKYHYFKQMQQDNKMSLSDPYLITYWGDSKQVKDRNEEIFKYLRSTSDSLKKETNNPK